MKDNIVELFRYIARGIALLIIAGMIVWCAVEGLKIEGGAYKAPVCDCHKGKK